MIFDIKNKKILVIGASGQLGFDVVKELEKNSLPYIAVGSKDLDITNASAVDNFFNSNDIAYVIDCAAYTKVDKAEEEKELNYNVNVIGTANIVKNCKKHDIPMIYFSTDYVFDGQKDAPYVETDAACPLGEYAKAKLLGENEVKKLEKYYILRISWVFGKNGNNFIKTMIKLSETKNELMIVSDQIGSPTYTVDIAKIVVEMMKSDKYGIYNVTNDGYVSWSDFARTIFKKINKDVNVIDISTEDYNAKAKRPKNSRLDKSKLKNNGFKMLPTWEDALDRFLKEIAIL